MTSDFPMVACSAVLLTAGRGLLAGLLSLTDEELAALTGRSGSGVYGFGLVVGCVVGFHMFKMNPFLVCFRVALPVVVREIHSHSTCRFKPDSCGNPGLLRKTHRLLRHFAKATRDCIARFFELTKTVAPARLFACN